MVIHADSSYLIDLLREHARGKHGRATAFLEDHASDHLLTSVFVACELEAGAANASSPDREQTRVRALLQTVAVVFPDEHFAPKYGQLLFTLQRTGKSMATMDLLIAVAAVVEGAALVTANRRHFEAIRGLNVLGY
jgi:predicted nucleic acid-binding protein